METITPQAQAAHASTAAHTTLLKSTEARISWPATRPAAGAPFGVFINPSVGSVELHSDRIVLRSGAEVRDIPLAALSACGEAVPPFWFSPARHRFAGIEFTDTATGKIQRIVFQASVVLFSLPETTALRAAEWLVAIRSAHQAATGRELPYWSGRWTFPIESTLSTLAIAILLPLTLIYLFAIFSFRLGVVEIIILFGGLACFIVGVQKHRAMIHAAPPAAAVPTSVETNPHETASRFSRTAIVGACWSLFFFMHFAARGTKMLLTPEQRTPSFGTMMLSLLDNRFLALSALFGTTILGWIAVSQISRSAGKLHGMGLAVFDGLLFPLLVVNSALIYWISTQTAKHPPFAVWIYGFIGISVPAIILINVFLVRWVWRKVNNNPSC